ncbi:hypothetical protein FQ010_22885, partial [Escherichia coli]|nr:hypothetical protein [Escherichia coli]
MTNYVNCKNSEGSGNYRKFLKSEWKNILLIFMGFTENNKGTRKCLYVSDLSFKGKRLARTVLIFTESSDQLSRATDRVP